MLPSHKMQHKLSYLKSYWLRQLHQLRQDLKKKKKRETLPTSEITHKVTFLMLTHTKRTQPLISADHMLPLLLAGS